MTIKILINNSIGNINTFDIGIVDSINDTNNTLNITLLRLFQSKYNAYETDVTIPTVQLYDIPVMRPNCRNFSLIPEYSVGDRVITIGGLVGFIIYKKRKSAKMP